ncbi:MAG: glycosyltransferase [Candidatus Roizmanbacteria bacterium]|nr:glycosyltransferase [Candidatus Roizmanbacteria bacterium]MCR4312906.1 glycosyltransferase [Candidatus Roizmanbacteria bacterium]
MKKPLVSVIIPVYNGQSYLKETILSVQKSNYKNFEIILVNDGSKDKSKELCYKLKKKYKNIRVFSFKKNRGLSNILNYAVRKAKGKYIARINQDDLMVVNRIFSQVYFLENNLDHVLVGGNLKLISEKGKPIDVLSYPQTDQEIRNNWLYLNSFADPAVMYRKKTFLKVGNYDQNFYPADDYHLWFRMGQTGKVANLNHVVIKFRVHDEAATVKLHKKMIESTKKVHEWAAENIQKPSLLVTLYWKTQYFLAKYFSPQFNFIIYRLIKKVIYSKSQFETIFFPKKIINRVKTHPKTFNFSGQ